MSRTCQKNNYIHQLLQARARGSKYRPLIPGTNRKFQAPIISSRNTSVVPDTCISFERPSTLGQNSRNNTTRSRYTPVVPFCFRCLPVVKVNKNSSWCTPVVLTIQQLFLVHKYNSLYATVALGKHQYCTYQKHAQSKKGEIVQF